MIFLIYCRYCAISNDLEILVFEIEQLKPFKVIPKPGFVTCGLFIDLPAPIAPSSTQISRETFLLIGTEEGKVFLLNLTNHKEGNLKEISFKGPKKAVKGFSGFNNDSSLGIVYFENCWWKIQRKFNEKLVAKWSVKNEGKLLDASLFSASLCLYQEHGTFQVNLY
jgi:hypothetical protein